jgi:peptide/nickel transport system substrate-binding protein
MKKLYYILVPTVVLILFLSACAKPSTAPAQPAPTASIKLATTPVVAAQPAPQYGGVMKIIYRSPISEIGSPTKTILSLGATGLPCFEFLVMQDKDFRIHPGLAESWDIAPEGKSITFHLRKGVKFQDGTDFNADAVKYNLQNQVSATYLQRVTSYDVIDNYTIRLNLKSFDALLLNSLAQRNGGMMASPTSTQISKDQMVGTGPFKFVSWQRDVNIKYQKFDGYWQKGKPYLDGVEFLLITDPVTSLMALKAGEGQALYSLTPQEANDLKSQGYDVGIGDQGIISQWMIPDGDNKDSPFGDVRVREAVEYAIDKKAIAQTLGKGWYEAAYQWAMSTDLVYDSTLKPREYDPSKAKQLLISAGYPNGFNTKIIAVNTANKDMLVAIQTYLKAAGINAELDLADRARMTATNKDGWKNGLLFPYIGGIVGNLSSFQTQFTSPSSSGILNHSMFWPSDWQAKLNAAIDEPNDDKLLIEYRTLMKLSYDNVMGIPLYGYMSVITANDKRVHDLSWGLGNASYFNIQGVWLNK